MNLFTKEKLINLLTLRKEFKDQRLLHFHYARTHTQSEGMHANSTSTLQRFRM